MRVSGLSNTDVLRVNNPGGAPPTQPPGGPFGIEEVYTNINPNYVCGEPDVWLQINVSGTDYVFPGYSA